MSNDPSSDPGSDPVIQAFDGEVLVMTLNRPEKRNALSLGLCRALESAVRDGAARARAIVLTGAGSTFCAGADLDGVYGEEFLEAHYGMLGAITGSAAPAHTRTTSTSTCATSTRSGPAAPATSSTR